MKVKLTELCDIQYGYAFDSTNFTEDNTYIPLVRIRDVKRGYSETFYTGEYSEEYILNTGDLLVGMDGEFNIARWKSGQALLNQRVCKITAKNGTNEEYLRFALSKALKEIENRTAFVTVKHLSAKELNKLELDVPDYGAQVNVAESLVRIETIIALRQQELQKLDELIKARFVEMFGDPLFNSLGLKTLPMTEVCEIIDGDRGKNYPTADEFSDEGYCLFLNAKNVTASGFNFDNCMYITKEKDEALRKGRLSRGDVVLTTRGTLGNLAFYTDEVPFEHVRINSGMVILRMKKDIIDESFFIEQFRMQLNDIKVKIASGSAQPQLPISTMNKIQILIPDIDKQREFATFVKQLDKSKVVIQKALEEARLLFDSLMQQYFRWGK